MLYFLPVSNPDDRVQLHWVEELEIENEENIAVMTDIRLLKYTLETPKPSVSSEIWNDGMN